MPTNAKGTGGIQLAGNAGAALYGPSLITVTRLLDNLNNRLLTSDEATTCANLIDSVSAAIRRYCHSAKGKKKLAEWSDLAEWSRSPHRREKM
jgi:hypothetical protein